MVLYIDHEVFHLIKNKYDHEKAKLLIEKENLHNEIDLYKNTLLHYAAEYGNPEIVQFLIDLGSQVDAKNDCEQTPLIRCFEIDSPCKDVIEILLRSGADILVQDIHFGSAFSRVNSVDWLEKDTKRIEILKSVLEYENLIFFLSSFEILVNGRKPIIESLLQTNINLSNIDVEGKTIVHVLAGNRHAGVVELLRDKKFNVNLRDDNGRTPLMYSASNCISRGVQLFLDRGADIDVTDNDQRTALFLAVVSDVRPTDKGKQDTIQILLERGANAQIEFADGGVSTIFDASLLDEDNYIISRIVIAHLAFQEVLGTAVTELIHSQIYSRIPLKLHYEYCQKQLFTKICQPATLFDLMTISQRKIESYLRNVQWAPKLIDFDTSIDYFFTIIHRRILEANEMVRLRKIAAEIICELSEYQLDYDCYPVVADQIVDYLEKSDIECLMSYDCELSDV